MAFENDKIYEGIDDCRDEFTEEFRELYEPIRVQVEQMAAAKVAKVRELVAPFHGDPAQRSSLIRYFVDKMNEDIGNILGDFGQ